MLQPEKEKVAKVSPEAGVNTTWGLPSTVSSDSLDGKLAVAATLQPFSPQVPSAVQFLYLTSVLPTPLPPPLGFSSELPTTSVSHESPPLTAETVAVKVSGLPLAPIVVFSPTFNSSHSH